MVRGLVVDSELVSGEEGEYGRNDNNVERDNELGLVIYGSLP